MRYGVSPCTINEPRKRWYSGMRVESGGPTTWTMHSSRPRAGAQRLATQSVPAVRSTVTTGSTPRLGARRLFRAQT